jgi:hypothetical protein
MRTRRWVAGMTALALAFGAPNRLPMHVTPPPMLLPGSPDLSQDHFASRCDSLWFLSRAPDDAADQAILAHRSDERLTSYRGQDALLLVTTMQGPMGPLIDSALVYLRGLTPIWEVDRNGPRLTRYEYDRNQVRVTASTSDSAPSVEHHRYEWPVFNFEELDALVRSLPLRPGYEALVPLFSEGDDAAEVDTVRVEQVDARGIWQIRFADQAVVATVGVDGRTRRQVAYSHRFRSTGPSWKVGTVWRRMFGECGAVAR